MPIYAYECSRGHQFETWQSIKEESLDRCTVRETMGHGTVRCCHAAARRIIVAPGGHVMEPNGVYQPLPGMDPKTKRGREEKITKREYEKRDQNLRAEMLQLSKRGPKLDFEPKKQHATWF
jgi:predicted nucleic acid-binding Zn ribbon protein